MNHAFSIVRGLFCIKSYWSQKKSPRKDFFSTGLFYCEILGLFSGNFFSKDFFVGYLFVYTWSNTICLFVCPWSNTICLYLCARDQTLSVYLCARDQTLSVYLCERDQTLICQFVYTWSNTNLSICVHVIKDYLTICIHFIKNLSVYWCTRDQTLSVYLCGCDQTLICLFVYTWSNTNLSICVHVIKKYLSIVHMIKHYLSICVHMIKH